VAVYWGFVTLIDEQIGRLLGALAADGVLDETLIIVTSDHGEMLGQHGLWHKMVPYEEAIRVPFVMRYPSCLNAGVRSQLSASLVDIAPTILSLVGEQVPEEMPGEDLLAVLKKGAEFQSGAFRFAEHKPLGEWHRAVEWRLVTDNRQKYIWHWDDLDELYDLSIDPYERLNLIDDDSLDYLVMKYRSVLHRWMRETSDPLLTAFELETGATSG
jgi:arylsulfatase A-like enzyme